MDGELFFNLLEKNCSLLFYISLKVYPNISSTKGAVFVVKKKDVKLLVLLELLF